MLTNQTIEKLDALGLGAMATGLAEQLSAPGTYDGLSFADRDAAPEGHGRDHYLGPVDLGLAEVQFAAAHHRDRRLAARLKTAKLRYPASVEELDFKAPRGLDRSVILALAQATWVREHHNVLITGPTGRG